MATAARQPRSLPVNGTQTPSILARQQWTAEHVKQLTALLDSKLPKETPQRIFRLRLFRPDELVVVTLVQTINPTGMGGAGSPVPTISVSLIRGYAREAGQDAGAHIRRLDLYGQYATDEIVAFLRLDAVDPAETHWNDETRYSNIVVVGDIIKHARRQD